MASVVAVAERIVKRQTQRGWLKALSDSGSDLDWVRHASIYNWLQIYSCKSEWALCVNNQLRTVENVLLKIFVRVSVSVRVRGSGMCSYVFFNGRKIERPAAEEMPTGLLPSAHSRYGALID